jgi:hypothetical protein
MEREKDQPSEQNDHDIPTIEETGRAPRPSQAEGDRETVEEDLGDRPSDTGNG